MLANELLDNLPFRLAVHDGAWREAFVTTAPDGSFAEVLSAPFDPVPAVLPARAAHGARAPAAGRRRGVGRAHARSSSARGTVVVVDYARPTHGRAGRAAVALVAAHVPRPRARHATTSPTPATRTSRSTSPLDQLPEPDAVRSQAQFLQLHGIAELVEEGRAAWAAAAAPARPARRMAMRSRVGEAEALLDPAGLGGFTVLEWTIAPLA